MAFTLSREIYSSLKRGGLVWLAEQEFDTDDQGRMKMVCLHLLHVACTFAAGAGNNEKAMPALAAGTDTVSSCVQDDRSLLPADQDITQTHPTTEGDGGVCV